jgi:hypothetical protein
VLVVTAIMQVIAVAFALFALKPLRGQQMRPGFGRHLHAPAE